MTVITIEKSKLEGTVTVSGAKNSVLRLLAATILTSDSVELGNYPASLLDAKIHVGMLEVLGKKCVVDEDSIIVTEDSDISSELIWQDRSIRNTLLILGSLVTRKGYGAVPLPGGCPLGGRSYDLHEMLLRKLGAEVWEEDGYLKAKAPEGGLVGADIYLPIRSTGATENGILAGCLASGITRVWNPHIRPEILDLISMLNKMGAKITVFGQEHIEIIGVESLSSVKHDVIADNMEAITWLVAAVMTKGDVEIKNFPFDDMEVPLIHLRESGAKFYRGDNSLIVRGGRCYPIEISTGPFPGINSDVQPILAAYAACAIGESCIVDLRFPGRYGYAEEFSKMGVNSTIDGNVLRINGAGGGLKGATVHAQDLRAGVALALCGLVAEGETVITDAWQILRGYNNFEEKLKALGGNISVE
jgi:UDP-N-acetylglucosamine 1-carboxyvinyltransferase